MKRWLKKHGKWVFVGVGAFFIGCGIGGLVIADTEWKVIVNIGVITIWLMLTLFVSGAMNKIWDWWERD